jgi:hypothetical protein
MDTYKVKLKYIGSGTIEEMEVTTDNIEWTTDQIQRNREPLTIEVNKL